MKRLGFLAVVGCFLSIATPFSHAAMPHNFAPDAGVPACPSMGSSPLFAGPLGTTLVLSCHGQEWPILALRGGRFSKVFPNTLISGQDRHGCVAADFSRDGLHDLMCGRGACKGICSKPYPKELYLGQGNGSFRKTPWHHNGGSIVDHDRSRYELAGDLNRDGCPDLITLAEASRAFPSTRNRLWYNNCRGNFVEQLPAPFISERGSITGAIVPSPDGYPDVVLVHFGGEVVWYKNNRGVFGNGVKLTGRGKAVSSGDLNEDGISDLVIVQNTAVQIRYGRASGPSFSSTNYMRSLSQGSNVSLCDLDGDRKLDVYVVQGKRPENQDVILINKSGTSFTVLQAPRSYAGYGDVPVCIPSYPGAVAGAVLVPNSKWSHRGPAFLVGLKP